MVRKALMLMSHVAMSLLLVAVLFPTQQDTAKAQTQSDSPQISAMERQKMNQGKPVKAGPFRVSEVIDKKVKNPQGEGIGSITDLISGQNGSLKYAILDHGGFLGIGSKLIPIPWEAVKRGPDKDTLIVNVTKESLEKAPNFDKETWPDFAEPGWEAKIEKYYVIDK